MARSRFGYIAFPALFAAAALTACDDGEDRRQPPLGFDYSNYDLEPEIDTAELPPPPDMRIVGPTVSLQVPGEAHDPENPAPDPDPSTLTSDQVVSDANFVVECEVVPGETGAPIDQESVAISVVDADGTLYEGVATNTMGSTTLYRATFDLSEAPNGELIITCSGGDLYEPPETQTQVIRTYLDLGPKITVINPIEGGSYARQLSLFFRVEADPVIPGDTMADVDISSVRADIGLTQIPDITQDEFGNFVATFDFAEPTLFDPPLDGPAILAITGSNVRQDTPVTRVEEVNFRADSDGASIAFNTPVPGDLVGGIFVLRVTVTDPAGIDPNSVEATIAGSITRQLDSIGGDQFEALVDARSLDPNIVNALLEVSALDLAGNQSENGITVTLDTRPPVADLDSVDVREINIDGECSIAFDPLGDDTPDDATAVPQLTQFRARIEDLGNGAPSTMVVIPKAGVNTSTPKLYVLDNEAGALIVDTDSDGICDEVNPNLVEAAVIVNDDNVAVVDLVAVPPAGKSHFSSDVGVAPDPVLPIGCLVGMEDPADIPDEICDSGSSQLTRVIKDELGNEPVIYAIPPITAFNCVGNAFDSLGANVSPGWACVAVRVEDNLGNVGVSRPFRACIDQGGGCDTANPPDCTGTYDPNTGVTDPANDCTLPLAFGSFGVNIRRNY